MFYKIQGKEFYFQLANLEPAREEYIFWKDGQVPPIPTREAINGITPREAYWDKTGTKQVAGYRADRSFIRDIIVTQGGINTQYIFAFKKRDTQQLEAEIGNIVNLQRKDPLTFNFKFRKTGQGKETIRVVIAMQEVGLPVNVQQSSVAYQTSINPKIQAIIPQSVINPIAPIKTPETSPVKATSPIPQGFELPKQVPNVQDTIALTEKEQVVYGMACDYVGTLSADDFVIGFKHTYSRMWKDSPDYEDITSQRALDIYNKLYSK